MITFKTKNGEMLVGKLIHKYGAFEGGMRYIISANGRDYRCIMDEAGNYIEYVA